MALPWTRGCNSLLRNQKDTRGTCYIRVRSTLLTASACVAASQRSAAPLGALSNLVQREAVSVTLTVGLPRVGVVVVFNLLLRTMHL